MSSFPVVVRPSTRGGKGGRGVFTTRAVVRGELLCIYDGFAATEQEVMDKRISNEYTIASADVDSSQFTYVGYRDPHSPEGVGQLINDACMPNLDVDAPYHVCQRVLVDYLRSSTQLRNCGPLVEGKPYHIYAMKDIAAGAECLTNYGQEYWVVRLLQDGEYTLTPLQQQLLFQLVSKFRVYDVRRITVDTANALLLGSGFVVDHNQNVIVQLVEKLAYIYRL